MTKEKLIECMDMSIAAIELIYKYGLELELENSQEFLDWLDKLNELSVRK